jgi:hypothetical protein
MRTPPTTIALLALVLAASCASEPETVLQSDLPQVPGLAPRDSSGIRQDAGRVIGGQFAYKGFVEDLRERVSATKARYARTPARHASSSSATWCSPGCRPRC